MGFAVRLLTRSLPEDESLPNELFEHHQATVEYLHTVQEAADRYMDGGEFLSFLRTACQSLSDTCPTESAERNPAVKPFLKKEGDYPFFIIPVLSPALFPQFKGTKSPGVLRTKGQKGTCLVPSYQILSKFDGFPHRTFVTEPK